MPVKEKPGYNRRRKNKVSPRTARKLRQKRRKRAGKAASSLVRFFSRTSFILMLLFFFGTTGLGLNIVLSCIKEAPDFDPRHFNQPLTSYIYDVNNREITSLHDGHNRVEVPLDTIPAHLQKAFIAIEDESFYDHLGISMKDMTRAALNNFLKQDLTDQGASTITQQLIKNAFLTSEKTFRRKIQEIWLALKMEQMYSKEEILEFYLNIIYFDHLAYGVEAAAQTYFGKNVSQLTLAESALLAGIPRSPINYSPYKNFEQSKGRQELVLDKMAEYGYITWNEARVAKEEPIQLSGLSIRAYEFPYFMDYVEIEARNILAGLDLYESPEAALNRGGLRIYTTLDPEIQKIVEDVVNDRSYYPNTFEDEQGKLQPQSAAVLAQPETGHIKGLAGGRDYGLHNQDLRYLSSRQPGSSIKPVLAYVPAMEKGLLFPGSVLDDAPFSQGNYFPENYDRSFRGMVTVRESLVWSYNVPAVRAYSLVTPETGMEYGRALGITTFDSRDQGNLSLTLGGFTYGTRPLEMAQVFAVFANQGIKVPLTSILRIENHLGQEIYRHDPRPETIIQPSTAYLITDVLKDVARRGTAARLGQVGRPIAAKTGTTQNNRDGWLISYTPDYVLASWIGFDLTTSGQIYNAPRYPVSMSIDIMRKVHKGLPPRDFEPPEGLVRATVCSKSGLRPSENCPPGHLVTDLFPQGQVPRESCEVHVMLEVCQCSGLLPTGFCPHQEKRSFFQREEPPVPTDQRWRGAPGRLPGDAGLAPPTETCDIHTDRPAAPAGLVLSSSPLGNQVYLQWSYPGDSQVTGYDLYRREGEGGYEKINTMPLVEQSFVDTRVLPGTTYHYQVIALHNQVESSPLSSSITTLSPGDNGETGLPDQPSPPSTPPGEEDTPGLPGGTGGNPGDSQGENKPKKPPGGGEPATRAPEKDDTEPGPGDY